MTDFERQLQGQQFREFARHWRNEILDKVEAAVRASRPSRAKTPLAWLDWLWPSPVAWVSLAVIWMFLVAIDLSDRHDMAPQSAASMALINHAAARKGHAVFAFQNRDDIDALVALR